MAFKGDLKNISLFDIFQTLNTNNQTGVLVLQREGATKKILFSPQGVRIFFTKSFRPLRLGEIFVRRGVITQQDVEILLLEQKREYRPMGELLVQGGKVSEAEVHRILRYHAEDELYEIFGWNAGTFSFYDGQTTDDHANTPLSDVVLDPSGLCLEAARRLDEMERIRQVIPTNDEFYVHAEGGPEPDREKCDRKLLGVFDALRSPETVDDLRDVVGLSLFDVLRSIHALAKDGFIRTLTLEETIAAAREAIAANQIERAALLFEKAHKREPENRALLEECVEVLRRLNDPARLGGHLASLGALCIAENLIEEGIEHLEQSLRMEPDNFRALSALRQAFAKQEDPERAAEVSLRIARAFADRGDLEQAIEACRSGLAIAPGGIALRYYLGQVLVRADRPQEAQKELYALVEETESSRRAMRSGKAHELLQSCYRLLLKIDPQDERALKGLKTIERYRSASYQRRMRLLRAGAVLAAVLVVVAIGFTLRGPDAEALYSRVLAAQEGGDDAETMAAIEKLLNAHPDSEEAKRAIGLRNQIERDRSSSEQTRRKREEAVRKEIQEEFDAMRDALETKEYLAGLALVAPFLERLNRAEAAAVRKGLVPSVQIALEAFLARVTQQFEKDRQAVAITDRDFQARNEVKSAATLRKLEEKLGDVRARRWPETTPALLAGIAALRASPYIGDSAHAIEEFRKKVDAGRGAFEVLDALYYSVRSQRLQQEIDEAVRAAQTTGAEHMRNCEFDAALKLYAHARQLMEGVVEERPRERYLNLLAYLENSGLLRAMRERVSAIEELIASLAEVERLRAAGDAAGAFRLFRPLVQLHVLVQFERRFRMPYMVESTPAGAEVFVNGRSVGSTPAAVELGIVENTKVVLRRSGFRDSESTLSPLDPKLDGTLHVQLDKEIEWSRSIPGPIEAAPVCLDDLVLVASRNGSLFALRAASGDLAWEHKTKVLEGLGTRPVAVGDAILAATLDGTVHFVDRKTGDPRRRLALPGGVVRDPALLGSTVYYATRNARLVAVRDGAILFDKPMRRTATTALVAGHGRVLAGTAEGEILVFDAETGEERKPCSAPNLSSFLAGLAVAEGKVVGGAEDGVLYGFEIETGALAWKIATGGRPGLPSVGANGVIYLPSRDGLVYAVRPTGEKGRPYELGTALSAAPVPSGEFLYAASGSVVSCFNTAQECAWWEHTLDKEAAAHLAAGSGRLFALTDRNRIVAFHLDER